MAVHTSGYPDVQIYVQFFGIGYPPRYVQNGTGCKQICAERALVIY
ncbi:hypothetical protein NIES4101_27020 (plasmid) [Calothrix sp. NIES-4101]|nr:hypothetical protein NIES4101_27020 [Calothrix sp. NIES-4101]